MQHKAIILSLIALLAVACAEPMVPNGAIEQESTSQRIKTIDRLAEKMKRKVLNSKSEVSPEGTIYYVSADGDDNNDGLSPKTPIRTLDRMNSLELQPSDGVMFRRGDVWRGRIYTKKGVTYSAYGRGEKPRIYGSPYDAVKVGEWVETETPNVYMFSEDLPDDVGTLVFNSGEQVARKITQRIQPDGSTTNLFTGEPFNSGLDLDTDLDFFHD